MNTRITVLAALVAGLGPALTHAQAQPAQTPPSPLAEAQLTWQQCQRLAADNEARLACYDRWAQQQTLPAAATRKGKWPGYPFQTRPAGAPPAPGGAYDYRIGKDMSRGFALVAWPAKYGETGIDSFIVSHDGEVFQKDLGPNGGQAAKAMKAFDPDSSWTQVPGEASKTATAAP